MSALHLVQIAVAPRALAAYAAAEGIEDDDLGYALHKALRRRYGAAGPQPFRLVERAGGTSLYGYACDPDGIEAAAALPPLDPRLDAVFPGPPRSRPMPDTWRRGQRLGFDLTARPVVRYGSRARAARLAAGRSGAGERDAFLAALEADGAEHDLNREDVYRRWLIGALGASAALESVRITSMRRLRVRRSLHARGATHLVEGYEVGFAGTLEIGEPDRFAALLSSGVGRHAAFGLGMLLLTPPDRV